MNWINKKLSEMRGLGMVHPKPNPRDFREDKGLLETERLWIIKRNLQDISEMVRDDISGLRYIVKTNKATNYHKGRLEVMEEVKRKIERCLDIATTRNNNQS